MLSDKTKESLIAHLQRYRQHAESNRNFGNTREPRQGYFATYPPEVQRRCWEIFSLLCTKHQKWVQQRKIGLLVATATRMALHELGINPISRKGFHTIRAMNMIRQRLGINDKREDQVANNRKRSRRNAKAAANVQKLNVSQLPLEC